MDMGAQISTINQEKLSQEQQHWADVYEAQMPRIYNYFRYRLQDEQVAEDLTAVTFEKAWRQRNRYQKKKAAITTWLFSIAKNVAIDYLRQAKADVEVNDAIPANHQPVEDQIQNQESLAQLAVLLEGLSARDAEIIALKYGASLTNREIARVTNLSSANIGIILFRTVRKLRQQWETNDER